MTAFCRLMLAALVCLCGHRALVTAQPVVTYAGGGANTRFHDVKELSDGTFLVAGISDNLDWLATDVPRVQIPVSGLPAPSGSRVSFILRLSGDTERILEGVHLPPGAVMNLRWMRSTEVPGQPTGMLYVSGQISGGYFIGRLNGNFVTGRPDAFDWIFPVSASGGHETWQAWDVGGDGRVVYAHGGEWTAQVGFLAPDGQPTTLPKLRASHWVGGAFERGLGEDFPAAAYSAIRLPTDNQSWDDAELFAITPDGNGGVRQGTWPIDIMVRYSFATGEPINVVAGRHYGYNGYRAEGRHWIGAVAVDRRNNHFYYGFNIKSLFWDAAANKEQPDFEPAVIGYDDEGRLKWWNRLYTEAADTTGDGRIDQTWVSPPDQYIDGLDVDYSAPLAAGGNVVVVGRCHGNNTSNFWSGNAIALNPGGNAFQNRFTGTDGNIHISYIARLRAADGNVLAASFLAGYYRKIISGKGNWPTVPYPEPIHDGWPNHNSGWADLTTTKIEPNALRLGPDGRVYLVGVGPRMVTTSNAHQRLPRRLGHTNPILNEGTCPWNHWVRAYEPMLDRLAYSSTLTGVWTYPGGDIDAEPVGADNTYLRGVWPVSGGLLVVGQHSNSGGTSAGGNAIPVANVPEWGSPHYNGITGIFGLLPFSDARPRAAFTATPGRGVVSVDAAGSMSVSPIVSYIWSFGDGAAAEGVAATHTYAAPGTYLVGLTVTNADGLRASSHRWVQVSLPPAVPVVRISGPVQAGHPMRLAFPTQPGVRYQLQHSATLAPSDWTDSGTPVAGTGEELEVEVEAPSAGAVFFRVVVVGD